MDAGAVVAWPARFVAGERSALQYAMNLRFRDEAAFFAEYQNEPLPADEAESDMLSADQIAAKTNGVPRNVVPIGANPVKVAAMRGLGSEVIEHGRDFDEAREYCAAMATQRGYRYIHSGNEPLLIAGVATLTLEILEAQPEIDVLIGPVGGGSGMAGACIVRRALRPGLELIAVQAAAAPAAYRSWKTRSLLEDKMETAAEGLATRVAFELPQRILWDGLDDFVLASEEELLRATRLMIETTKTLVEPAGAAALAAALTLRDRLQGRRVALVCSGGNISPSQLQAVLAA